MKMTIEISDALLTRIELHARKTGKPVFVLVEEGIRRILDDEPSREDDNLPDRSVGSPRAKNSPETLTWRNLRDEIYGGH